MRTKLIVFVMLQLSISSLVAETMNVESLNEIIARADSADKLAEQGQSVKSKRIWDEIDKSMVKYIKTKKKFTLPAACSFLYKPSGALDLSRGSCDANNRIERIDIEAIKDDPLLEKLQECQAGFCSGEFILSDWFWTHRNNQRYLIIHIRFMKINQQ